MRILDAGWKNAVFRIHDILGVDPHPRILLFSSLTFKRPTKTYLKKVFQLFTFWRVRTCGIRIHTSDLWIRIREAQKHVDPQCLAWIPDHRSIFFPTRIRITDKGGKNQRIPELQHWIKVLTSTNYQGFKSTIFLGIPVSVRFIVKWWIKIKNTILLALSIRLL